MCAGQDSLSGLPRLLQAAQEQGALGTLSRLVQGGCGKGPPARQALRLKPVQVCLK